MKNSLVGCALAIVSASHARATVTVKHVQDCSAASITNPAIVEVVQSAGVWTVVVKANGTYFICADAGDVIGLIRSDGGVALKSARTPTSVARE